MAYRDGYANFHTEVATAVNSAFVKQLKARGQVKNDATTAALRLWLELPPDVQALLTSAAVDAVLLPVLKDRLFRQDAAALGPIEHMEALLKQLLKQLEAERPRRKKASK